MRSCYKTQMRFYSSDPTNLQDVSWYFSPVGAQLLTIPTPFTTGNYVERDGMNLLGEDDFTFRNYSKGAVIGATTGLHHCGPTAAWADCVAEDFYPEMGPDRFGNVSCCTGLQNLAKTPGFPPNPLASIVCTSGPAGPFAMISTGGAIWEQILPGLGTPIFARFQALPFAGVRDWEVPEFTLAQFSLSVLHRVGGFWPGPVAYREVPPIIYPSGGTFLLWQL